MWGGEGRGLLNLYIVLTRGGGLLEGGGEVSVAWGVPLRQVP